NRFFHCPAAGSGKCVGKIGAERGLGCVAERIGRFRARRGSNGVVEDSPAVALVNGGSVTDVKGNIQLDRGHITVVSRHHVGCSRKRPLRQPHYLLLSLAVGGTQGGDPAATEFPTRFEVDYVRVYRRKAGA